MTSKTDFETEFESVLMSIPDEQYDQSQFVPGSGPFSATIVFVGEAPGEQEVEQNEPFVGAAGSRLRSTLDDVGLDGGECYFTNLVKIRPPENRNPHRVEIEAWKPVLEAELDRIDPAVIVTLGTFATQELLGADTTISAVRGTVHERNGQRIVPTYHPAASFYDESVADALAADLRLVVTETGSS